MWQDILKWGGAHIYRSVGGADCSPGEWSFWGLATDSSEQWWAAVSTCSLMMACGKGGVTAAGKGTWQQLWDLRGDEITG